MDAFDDLGEEEHLGEQGDSDFSDGDPAPPPTTPRKGARAKAGSKSKTPTKGAGDGTKAADKSLPAGKAAPAPSVVVSVKACLCCPLPRKKGSRFCDMNHHPAWENMRGQAMSKDKGSKGGAKGKAKAKAKPGQVPGGGYRTHLQLFNDVMADDSVARQEVQKHFEENVCTKKFQRRSLVNWHEFHRRHISRHGWSVAETTGHSYPFLAAPPRPLGCRVSHSPCALGLDACGFPLGVHDHFFAFD